MRLKLKLITVIDIEGKITIWNFEIAIQTFIQDFL